MGYKSEHPVTASNCPTRAALERKPGDKGFATKSIGARHSAKKTAQHAANLLARQMNAKPKAPKAAKREQRK